MTALSVLVHLPVTLTTAFGLVLIGGHNLLDSIQSSNPIWTILHSPNFILQGPRIPSCLCALAAHSSSEARINDTPLASGPAEMMAMPKQSTTTARLPMDIE